MLGGYVPGGTSAAGRWGAGGNADGVGDVAWHELPDFVFVRDHKAELRAPVMSCWGHWFLAWVSTSSSSSQGSS